MQFTDGLPAAALLHPTDSVCLCMHVWFYVSVYVNQMAKSCIAQYSLKNNH